MLPLPLWSALGALLVLPPQQGLVRLSEPFPTLPGGDVRHLAVSPDQQWTVFSVDDQEDDHDRILALPAGSTTLQLVADSLGPLMRISHLEVTPQNDHVLFTTRLDTLFSVPIDGSSPPVDLTGPLMSSYRPLPGAPRVLIAGDLNGDQRKRLYSVALDGSLPRIVLNGPLTGGGDVEEFEVSPDGAWAVYRADAIVDGLFEPFAVPIASPTAAIRLDPQSIEGALAIDATSSYVVYRHVFSTTAELFSVPIDGSSPSVLLDSQAPAQEFALSAALNADEARVVYRKTIAGRVALLSVRIDGTGLPVRLSPESTVGDVEAFRLSPDGSWVVFLGDLDVAGRRELHAAPTAGTSPAVKLNGALDPDEDVLLDVAFSADGAVVAFAVGDASGSKLFRTPVDASAPPQNLAAGPLSYEALEIGSNGVHVFFEKRDARGDGDLWSVRMDGSLPAIQLSSGVSVTDRILIQGGAGVLYLNDVIAPTVVELFARPASGAVPALRINPPLPDNFVAGSVSAPVAAGDHVLYVAGPGYERPGLYSVPLSRQRPPVRISGTGPGSLESFDQVERVGEHVLVRGRSASRVELHRMALDGSEPLQVLSAPLQPTGDVLSFQVSADGLQVVYQADQESDNVVELYRAPVDGSSAPVKLNGPLALSGDVAAYRLTGTADRVVYLADQDISNVLEVYSADGSGPPVKLNTPLTAAGTTVDAQLSPDDAWVYYTASEASGFYQLYRTAVDGSTQPQILSTPSNLRVFEFRVSPDGSWIVFRGIISSPGLYSVPSDGSSAPVLLASSSFPIGEFEIDPFSTRVVYRVFHAPDYFLAVNAIDGSGSETLLGPLRNVGRTFTITADGARVVVQEEPPGCCLPMNLYSVPIDGSEPYLQLNDFGGSTPVVSHDLHPGGERVAFTAGSPRRLWSRRVDGSRPPVAVSPPVGSGFTGAQTLQYSPAGEALLLTLDTVQPQTYDLYAWFSYRTAPSAPPTRFR